MSPFLRATVVTLKTITPLSGLRGVITESDAPAESEERRRRIRTWELRLYCLLREAVKQRTPIKAGCRTEDVMWRYECRGEAALTIESVKNLQLHAVLPL